MNFGEITTRVRAQLNSEDAAVFVNEWVKQTQRTQEINGNYKCMEVRATVASSEYKISIPNLSGGRFKEAIAFKVQDGDTFYELLKDSIGQAEKDYPSPTTEKGRPKVFATHAATNEFFVRPTPDKSYTFDLYFYQYLPELSADSDTNWWTNNAWDLLIYGTLIKAEAYLNHPDKALFWQSLHDRAVGQLQLSEVKEKWAGSRQRMVATIAV